MHFSAISALSFLGIALLAQCSPIALEAREANNLPQALSFNERDVTTPETEKRASLIEVGGSFRREADLEPAHIQKREKKVTQADVDKYNAKVVKQSNKVQKIENKMEKLKKGSIEWSWEARKLQNNEITLFKMRNYLESLQDKLNKGQ